MSADETEIFINLIQSYPCIWNAWSHDYRNSVLKDRVWVFISEELKKTVNECKRQWKTLREKYNRERKYWKGKTGNGGKFKEEWPYYQKMMFLNDVLQPRGTYSNLKFQKRKDFSSSRSSMEKNESELVSNCDYYEDISNEERNSSDYMDDIQTISSERSSPNARGDGPKVVILSDVRLTPKVSVIPQTEQENDDCSEVQDHRFEDDQITDGDYIPDSDERKGWTPAADACIDTEVQEHRFKDVQTTDGDDIPHGVQMTYQIITEKHFIDKPSTSAIIRRALVPRNDIIKELSDSNVQKGMKSAVNRPSTSSEVRRPVASRNDIAEELTTGTNPKPAKVQRSNVKRIDIETEPRNIILFGDENEIRNEDFPSSSNVHNQHPSNSRTKSSNVPRKCLSRKEWSNKIKKPTKAASAVAATSTETIENQFSKALDQIMENDVQQAPYTHFEILGKYIVSSLSQMKKLEAREVERKLLQVINDVPDSWFL